LNTFFELTKNYISFLAITDQVTHPTSLIKGFTVCNKVFFKIFKKKKIKTERVVRSLGMVMLKIVYVGFRIHKICVNLWKWSWL